MLKQAHLKKIAWILCIALALFGAGRLYYYLTDDFHVGNIQHDFSNVPTKKIPTLTQDEYEILYKVLDGKFYYLGKGAQCYAFQSEDGKYVIKFFKFKHLRPRIFIKFLPNVFPFKTFKENHLARRKKRLINACDGYDLAFNESREETQLLYLHLAQTDFLKRHIKIIDKLGIMRSVNADDIIFLIQKKGITLEQRLRNLLDQDQIIETKQAIEMIIDMYVNKYKKGIIDHDHGVMLNTGFIETTPFYIDPCKFFKKENIKNPLIYTKDLELVTNKIRQWIKVSYPTYEADIDSFIKDKHERLKTKNVDSDSID